MAYFLVPPKLDIDLGSSVSSVSDPDISGMSDKEPAKKDDQQKAAHAAEPAKPGDESQSEGTVSSYVSLLPGCYVTHARFQRWNSFANCPELRIIVNPTLGEKLYHFTGDYLRTVGGFFNLSIDKRRKCS